MRCENNLMETTLKRICPCRRDQQPDGGRWRKILRAMY